MVFLEIFADYFGDLDDVAESAFYTLHLTRWSSGFSLRLVIASNATVWVSIKDLLNRSLPRAPSVEKNIFLKNFYVATFHVFLF